MAEKDLSQNIVYYRKAKGLSQEKVAEYMGVSRQAVTKWESGLSRPGTDNLIKLSELLGVKVEVLIGSDIGQKTDKRQDIVIGKLPLIFIAVSLITIMVYMVVGIVSKNLSAGTFICVFIMAVPMQLFVHLYFANAVKNSSFTGLAGYNSKTGYDIYEVKKLLADMDVRLGMSTTVYIVLICAVSIAADSAGSDWVGLILLLGYATEFIAIIVVSNYNSIDCIYTDEADKKRARLGILLAVIYCLIILTAVIILMVLFEIRGITNNTPSAGKLAGWFLGAVAAATVGLITESLHIDKLNENDKYRPGLPGIVCLIVTVIILAGMVQVY